MDTIKSCPFCGGKAELSAAYTTITDTTNLEIKISIKCPNCGIEKIRYLGAYNSYLPIYNLRKLITDVITEWNTRIDS